jgi:phosphoglucosamine mutase
VQAALAQARATLGEEGRVVVRYSGTENKIRLLVEARTPEQVETWTDALTRAVQADLT